MVTAVGLALVTLVGVFDFATGYELSFSIFYLIPIVLVSWCLGSKAGHRISWLSAFVWLLADWSSGHPYSYPWIPIWNMLVRLGFFLIVASILPELKIRLEKESELARRDELTGLPNTRSFYETAENEIRVAAEQGTPLSLAFVEADGLKWINERYGRLAGDQMVCAVAEAIQERVSAPKLVARAAGSLFAILLPDKGAAVAQATLRDLQKSLRDETNRKYKRPMNFGIAGCTFLAAPNNVGALMQEADSLMRRLTDTSKDEIFFEVVEP